MHYKLKIVVTCAMDTEVAYCMTLPNTHTNMYVDTYICTYIYIYIRIEVWNNMWMQELT